MERPATFSVKDGPWAEYAPGKDQPWDLRRVVHLHRRAGFAATWNELQRDLKDGPRGSIERLLAGKARSEGVPDAFEAVAGLLAEQALRGGDLARLKGWWLHRMFNGPDPLTERLCLLWHNHFATSNDKVNDPAAMHAQNELFRRHGRGPFGKLLAAVVKGPALLVYLDAPANRKGKPNENLARELMELFTLGIGNYSEKDVKEAARALTGWSVAREAFHFRDAVHDDGDKTILGRRGRWTGEDLLGMLLRHPATARRLAGRLCEWFMGEGAVTPAAREALADGLRAHDLDVGWAVGVILRSRAFFAPANLGNRFAGPVEYVIAAARALELFEPPPSSLLLAEWTARLGQDLFCPPNVGGWPGGRSWVTTQSVIGRANFAAALVSGRLFTRGAAPDLEGLARRQGRGKTLDDLITFFAQLLTGAAPAPSWRGRLLKSLGPRATVRRAVALILASPEVQLS